MRPQDRIGTARAGALAVATAIVWLVSACTWVALTPEAEHVRLVDEEAVSDCKKLGKVDTTTAHRVGVIPRSQLRVQRELATLARNEAAKMGGDTVAAVTGVRDGRRTFNIYRCQSDTGAGSDEGSNE